MAPAQKPTTSARAAAVKGFNNNRNFLQKCYKKYLNFDFVKYLIFNPEALPIVSVLILFAEFLLNVFIIERVPYTEIDWKAYMQECEGFINGTTNYALLKGDTGPLVYPAAFVYIYTLLYYITSHGQNIHLAQYIFGIIYLLQMYLVLRLYSKSRKVPPYILAISAFTSYRIHSIYVLRLFNDPIAILFLYAALNLFLDRHWSWGSICYSLGVACKMNILLCSPALFLFYIISLGFSQALVQLCICAVVQLVVGLPFLFTYPLQYITGSFNLGRVFEHKWTVNYRFLPVEWFESKHLHIGLLVLNILLLLLFIKPTAVFFKNYVRLRELQKQFEPQIKQQNQQQQQPIQPQYDRKNKQKKSKNQKTMDEKTEETLTAEEEEFLKSFERGLQRTTGLKQPRKSTPPLTGDRSEKVSVHFDQCSQLALLPIFVCNFIGVVCARSLHYQFYVWYFHSLPYMAWSTPYSLGLRCLLLGLIEYCWNTYPSTNFSSFLLHLCHVLLLIGVGHNMFKTICQSQHIQHQNHEQQQNSNENGSLNLVKDKNN